MSRAKKEVEKMIANRQKKNKAYRDMISKAMGPNAIVLEFICAMESATKNCKTNIEFDDTLTREAKLLDDRMRRIDDGVQMEVVYNHSDVQEHWRDLSVDGMKIVWSDRYVSSNPGTSKELHIDIGSLLLDGALS